MDIILPLIELVTMKSIIILNFLVFFVTLIRNGTTLTVSNFVQDPVWIEGGPASGNFNKNISHFSILEDSQGDLFLFGGYEGIFHGEHFVRNESKLIIISFLNI
jgi:hypothetical protein